MILIPMIFISFLIAEDIRYLDEVFETVEKTEDVVYGNAPDLPFLFLFEWNTYDIDLEMDIYEPAGDTITNRPVVVFVHTGAFFSGHNELDDVVDLSIAAAKRGYVAISINYRLGLNVLSTYSAERAVYRAVQDGGAAIRFLRQYSDEFRINPDNIFMWGTSAGAFVALHLSYLDDNDRPEATYGGTLDPDLGCTVCEGNTYEQDPKPNAIVSCWGAIADLEWIEFEDKIPAIMFHGTSDPIVPFNSGYPFTIDIALPIVYGSNLIKNRMDEVQIYNEIYAEEGLLHEYWGAVNGNWFGGPNEYFDQIQNDAFLFLYNNLDFSNSNSDIGGECILDNGDIGFFDCEFCCWNIELLNWLGDNWCDEQGGCAWEGPQYNCPELGYDCGDCNDYWDGYNESGLCFVELCNPVYDANIDGTVNILDVIVVSNFILGVGELSCSIDYDGDNIINIIDIIELINLILESI